MPLLRSEKILFIHIPKTGGTSIEAALKTIGPLELFDSSSTNQCQELFGHSPQHCTIQELAKLGISYKDYQTFAVVRHPYERVVSEYNIQLMAPIEWCRINREPPAAGRLDFDEFLSVYLDKSPESLRRFDNHQLSCSKYLTNELGEIDPAVLIIPHTKTNLIKIASDRLSFSDESARAKFEQRNSARLMTSPPRITINSLSDAHKQLIAKAFADDFENFGFEK